MSIREELKASKGSQSSDLWTREMELKIELLEKKINSFSFNKVVLISSLALNAIIISIALFWTNNDVIINF